MYQTYNFNTTVCVVHHGCTYNAGARRWGQGATPVSVCLSSSPVPAPTPAPTHAPVPTPAPTHAPAKLALLPKALLLPCSTRPLLWARDIAEWRVHSIWGAGGGIRTCIWVSCVTRVHVCVCTHARASTCIRHCTVHDLTSIQILDPPRPPHPIYARIHCPSHVANQDHA